MDRDEVMLWMAGDRQPGKGGSPAPQGILGLAPIAQPGPCPGFLNCQLHAGRGVGRELEACSGVVDRLRKAPGHQRKPGQQLKRPGHDLLMVAFLGELVGGIAGPFGCVLVAEVELEDGKQRGQPSTGHEQVAVLGDGQPAPKKLVDLAEAPLDASFDQRGWVLG